MSEAIQLANKTELSWRGFITSKEEQFAKLISDKVGLDRFLRVAITAINRSPDLQRCTPMSLLASMMDAAQLGLEIGGPLQEGWLIAYGTEAQFQPGYRGLISLLIGHGVVKKVEARLVFERDEFSVEYGLDPRIIHRPHIGDDRGEMCAVYAVAWLANGETQFDVLSPDDIERARSASRSASSAASPWRKHEGEMWKKTAVKRLVKYLRLKGKGNEKVTKALELDERDYADAEQDIPEVPGASTPGRKLSLRREQPMAEADIVERAKGEEPTKAEAPPVGDDPETGEPIEAACERWLAMLEDSRKKWDKAPAVKARKQWRERLPESDVRLAAMESAYRDTEAFLKGGK